MPTPQNILVSVGETSGDLHAAALLKCLKQRMPECTFWGMCGPALRSEAAETLVRMEEVEVMGLVEVLGSLWRVRKAMKVLERSAEERRPAAAILTDFADFHLRLAKRLRRQGIPIIYFISPKLWAWREGRVGQIKRLVDLMISILPFETEFYAKRGFNRVFYAGNPLVDELMEYLSETPAEAARSLGFETDRLIAVLPGSRNKEIRNHTEPFMRAVGLTAERVGGNVQIAAALPDQEKAGLFEKLAGRDVKVLVGEARRLLRASRVALIASGTAALEAGILGTPAVVGYRVNLLTYLIGRALVKGIRFIGLPNLILDREVYPEFIQSLDAEKMAEALTAFWEGKKRSGVLASLNELKGKLGPEGVLERAAGRVAALLEDKG